MRKGDCKSTRGNLRGDGNALYLEWVIVTQLHKTLKLIKLTILTGMDYIIGKLSHLIFKKQTPNKKSS